MARGGGKGKVSNNLVAASCAAVLSVYAAGYWRTREEARQFDIRAQERKAVRPEPPAATAAQIAPVAPTPSPPEAPRKISPPTVTPAAPPATAVAAKTPAKAVAAEPLPPAAAPQVVTETPSPIASAIESPPAPPAPAGNWRDGTYTAWGTSRHGDLKVRVVIKNGRIVESSIDSCETAYPCDVITSIFNQPVERQSAEVDRVSRATESADAYYYGVLYALKDALVQPPDEATTPR